MKGILLVGSVQCVGHEGCCCGLGGMFRYIVVFESRYNMVGQFAIQYFCGGFLDGKMTAWLIG